MRKIKPRIDKFMTKGPGGMVKKEGRPIYPTIRLDLKHIDEAKDWKLGRTYNLELTVKLVGLSQSRFDNSAEFEIREIETDDSKSEDLSDEDKGKDQRGGASIASPADDYDG